MKQKDKIPLNIKIQKQKNKYGINKYGVVNLDNNKVIVPYEYDKITPLGTDTLKACNSWDRQCKIITNNNLSVLTGNYLKVAIVKIDKSKPADIANSIYIGVSEPVFDNHKALQGYITIPSRSSKDIIRRTIEQNNKISHIKFNNYPDDGFFTLKNDNKYGFLRPVDDDYFFVLPVFDNIYPLDKYSLLFQMFGISNSYSDDLVYKKESEKETDIHPFYDFIDEDIDIKDGNIYITYKSKSSKYTNLKLSHYSVLDILVFYRDELIEDANKSIAGNDVLCRKNNKKEIRKVLNKITSKNTLDELYKKYNKVGFLKFYNYPKEGMLLTSFGRKKGLIIFQKEGNKVIPKQYEDFYFQDMNSLIYRTLGITYSNNEAILAKKDGKWGIINKNNEIISDFQYDKIVQANAKENAILSHKMYGRNVDIHLNSIEFPKKDYIIVEKGNLAGVINSKGENLVPLKERFNKQQLENLLSDNDGVVKEGSENIQKAWRSIGEYEDFSILNSIDSFFAGVFGFGEIIALPFLMIFFPSYVASIMH